MSQGELQNAAMEGRNGTLEGQKWSANGSPEGSKWTLQQPKLRGGASWAAKMELKSGQCANMAQQMVFGRIWGAQNLKWDQIEH